MVTFALLSIYSIQGSPIITKGISRNEFAMNQISSISQFKNIEARHKKSNYSWVSSSGFDEDEATYSDMFY
jgi:hypothetical protein